MLDFKPGDEAVVTARSDYDRTIVTIERVTKTLVLTKCGGRYRRGDGRKQGTRGFFMPTLRALKKGEKKRLLVAKRHRAAVDRLNYNVEWGRLSKVKVAKIIKLLDAG